MAGDDSRQGPRSRASSAAGRRRATPRPREKGEWAGTASEGSSRRSSADPTPRPRCSTDDPSWEAPRLGRTTGSDEPATDGGIDPAAGDNADATTDGGPRLPDGAEPDTKDVAAAAVQREKDDAG